jgi:hypothetical protein
MMPALRGAGLGLALCLAVGLATAQVVGGAGGADGPWSPPAESAGAIEQVQGIVDAFTSGVGQLAGGATPTAAALKAIGARIAAALFGVLLAWNLIKGWVLGKGFQQLLPDLLQPLLVLGLALWAVDGLATPIEVSVLTLGRVVAGAVGADQALNETGLLTTLGVSGLELLMTPVAHGLHPLDWLVGKAACLASALILMLCGVVGAGIMIVAKFQTAIAILFAPVLIPWAMWPATTFVFNAWLNFLLAGAMTQTMVTIVAAMTTTAVERLCAVVASYAGKEVSLVAFGALFLGAALIAWLFLSVPRLASGLVAGAALGIQGWTAPANAAGRGVSTTTTTAHGTLRAGLRALDAGHAAGRAAQAAQRGGAGFAGAAQAAAHAGAQRWRNWNSRGIVEGVATMLQPAAAPGDGRRPRTRPAPDGGARPSSEQARQRAPKPGQGERPGREPGKGRRPTRRIRRRAARRREATAPQRGQS